MRNAVLGRLRSRSLLLLLICYVLAVFLPGPGFGLRGVTISMPGTGKSAGAQTVLLAAMLAGAGLSVPRAGLGAMARQPLRLLLAVAVSAALPLIVVPAFALAAVHWHDRMEAEAVAVGLLLVLAMPVAGGAVSWAQRADANVPLIVGAVVGSTPLSPLTIPWSLRLTGHLVGPQGAGVLDDTQRLHQLAGTGAVSFTVGAVVLPCLLGVVCRAALGEPLARRLLPTIKHASLAATLTLGYVNAAAAFTWFRKHPDPDLALLALLTLTAAAAACALALLLGTWCSRLTRSPLPDAVSLTLATAMSNSGAAAVLASTWFPRLPGVLLPILCYSLLQKTAASTTGPGPIEDTHGSLATVSAG